MNRYLAKSPTQNSSQKSLAPISSLCNELRDYRRLEVLIHAVGESLKLLISNYYLLIVHLAIFEVRKYEKMKILALNVYEALH